MVHALLDGSKTQTRRVIRKVQQNNCITLRKSTNRKAGLETHVIDAPEYPQLLPIRATVGDRLWVREAWAALDACTHSDPGATAIANRGFYRADHIDGLPNDISLWRPSIHMPRWASRLTLTVTDVRVQRVQDIIRGDAMEEGCPFPNMAAGPDPREWFAEIWGNIHGSDAWDRNDWVAAYTFTVGHHNIDAVAP